MAKRKDIRRQPGTVEERIEAFLKQPWPGTTKNLAESLAEARGLLSDALWALEYDR